MAMPARPLLVLAALLLAALLLSATSAADSKSNGPVTFIFTLPVPASCGVLHSFWLLFLRAPNLSGTGVHGCELGVWIWVFRMRTPDLDLVAGVG